MFPDARIDAVGGNHKIGIARHRVDIRDIMFELDLDAER